MGSSLAKPVFEKETLEGTLASVNCRWAASSMQGWSKHMEDEFRVVEKVEDKHLDDYSFFGVFDGHGGDKISKACKERLLDEVVKCAQQVPESATQSSRPTSMLASLSSYIWRSPTVESPTEQNELTSEEIEKFMVQGYMNCDKYLCEHQSEIFKRDEEEDDFGEEPERSGSTAVSVLLSNKYIFIANCGDSRAILSTGDEIISTTDHKPTLPSEKERILAAGGIVLNKRVNGMLAVSRAIGDFDYKAEPEIAPEKQAVSPMPDVKVVERTGEEEFLIIACDGVWDVMTNQELVDYIRYLMKCKKSASLNEICDNVLDTCLYKGSRDNLTIILIAFNDHVPAYDESVSQADAELEARLEAKAEEILKNDFSIDGITGLMYALADLKIEGLPPGGGLASKFVPKRPIVEKKFNAIRPPPVPEPDPMPVDEEIPPWIQTPEPILEPPLPDTEPVIIQSEPEVIPQTRPPTELDSIDPLISEPIPLSPPPVPPPLPPESNVKSLVNHWNNKIDETNDKKQLSSNNAGNVIRSPIERDALDTGGRKWAIGRFEGTNKQPEWEHKRPRIGQQIVKPMAKEYEERIWYLLANQTNIKSDKSNKSYASSTLPLKKSNKAVTTQMLKSRNNEAPS